MMGMARLVFSGARARSWVVAATTAASLVAAAASLGMAPATAHALTTWEQCKGYTAEYYNGYTIKNESHETLALMAHLQFDDEKEGTLRKKCDWGTTPPETLAPGQEGTFSVGMVLPDDASARVWRDQALVWYNVKGSETPGVLMSANVGFSRTPVYEEPGHLFSGNKFTFGGDLSNCEAYKVQGNPLSCGWIKSTGGLTHTTFIVNDAR